MIWIITDLWKKPSSLVRIKDLHHCSHLSSFPALPSIGNWLCRIRVWPWNNPGNLTQFLNKKHYNFLCPHSSKPTPPSALFAWVHLFSMESASCPRMTPAKLTISACRDWAWHQQSFSVALPKALQPGDKWPLKSLTFSVISSPLFKEPRQLPKHLLPLMMANLSVPQVPVVTVCCPEPSISIFRVLSLKGIFMCQDGRI